MNATKKDSSQLKSRSHHRASTSQLVGASNQPVVIHTESRVRQPKINLHIKDAAGGNRWVEIAGDRILAQNASRMPKGVKVERGEKVYEATVVGEWYSNLAKQNAAEVIEVVRSGIEGEVFVAAADSLGLSRSNLGRIIGMSPATSARKSKAGELLDPAASERLARIAMIEQEAAEVFGSSEKGNLWLTKTHSLLRQAPIELLDTEFGANEVRKILTSIAYGGAV